MLVQHRAGCVKTLRRLMTCDCNVYDAIKTWMATMCGEGGMYSRISLLGSIRPCPPPLRGGLDNLALRQSQDHRAHHYPLPGFQREVLWVKTSTLLHEIVASSTLCNSLWTHKCEMTFRDLSTHSLFILTRHCVCAKAKTNGGMMPDVHQKVVIWILSHKQASMT